MKRSVVILTVLLAIVAAVPVSAQSVVGEAEREAARGIPDRWGLNLGTFWQTFDTRLRLDGTEGQTGSDIEVETDLGLPDNATNFQLSGFYRFSDRSRLDVAYLGWDRKASRTIEEQIEWGDVIYDVGATIDGELSGRMANVVYKYSIVNNEKVTFGFNGGISSVWTEAKLSGEGTVAGGGTASGTIAESESVVVPVPVLGLHFEMALARKLFWRADGNFFTAKISGYDGRLSEITTSVNYYFTRNIGAGAGFSSTSLKVKKETSGGGEFDVRLGFSGAIAYLTAAF